MGLTLNTLQTNTIINNLSSLLTFEFNSDLLQR